MLATFEGKQFDEMNDFELGAACFKPIIQAYKRAQVENEDFVTTVYSDLSDGQKALFIFWTYYSHVKVSEADCYYWSALYMAQPERWTGLFRGLQFFEDRHTLPLVEEMDVLLKGRNHPRSLDHFDVSYEDINEDPRLKEEISIFYEKLLDALPVTIGIISRYIREHPSKFFELTNSH
ncbi:hypothetical protein I6N90_18995 [Paenibacillus sp. GSMTC-2017]|uniref:hypothetical protein n=1 Tax=Paenibacillus sp. GSMTC-2017 TaxID=2794350 RepID=UPI0018D6A9E3|nr:hypothetical protein [Paenibacillus sp. GSMTC-2017]MBH5319890.1 hypothetical protein [Paenibacillus sp. GSMTC-2017]